MNPLCILDAAVHHVRFHINTYKFKRPNNAASRAAANPLPNFDTTLPSDTSDPVVFAGGDLRYLELYGPAFIESIARVSDRLRVHVHIMLLEGEDCSTQQSKLLELLPSERLSFSVEVCETPPQNWHLKAQFFQVRRFLRLSQLVSLRKFDVLSADIDTVFLKSPEFLSNEWPEHDLLLQMNLGPLRPTPFSCACSWLRPSVRVREILSNAEEQMQKHASTGFYVDHIDERCFADEIHKNEEMDVVALPDNFCSSNSDDAYIFDGVGHEKNRIHSVFNAHVSRPETRCNVERFRTQCMVGKLRQIHFKKAWNKDSFSIIWRRILE